MFKIFASVLSVTSALVALGIAAAPSAGATWEPSCLVVFVSTNVPPAEHEITVTTCPALSDGVH